MEVSQYGKLRTLKVSSSAVTKTIKRYVDRHRKGRLRVTSAAEDKFIRVNCTSDRSQNKCFRVQVTNISTSTIQRTLHEIRPSWSNSCKEPTIKRTPIIRRDLLGPRNTRHGHRPGGNLSFGLMSPNLTFLVATAVSM